MWDRNDRRLMRDMMRETHRMYKEMQHSHHSHHEDRKYKKETKQRNPIMSIVTAVIAICCIVLYQHPWIAIGGVAILIVLAVIFFQSLLRRFSRGADYRQMYQQPYQQTYQQPYNQPNQPPYQAYNQGYRADRPQVVQPHQVPPSYYDQYEVPQSQYPLEMPPME